MKMNTTEQAKFRIGDVVKHRIHAFRGIVFDVDPTFNNSEEWYRAIPEDSRPNKDQPFYHLFAENEEIEYIAYVSEQNLLPDENSEPLRSENIAGYFDKDKKGRYTIKKRLAH
jgi:heat shock protein HspQ